MPIVVSNASRQLVFFAPPPFWFAAAVAVASSIAVLAYFWCLEVPRRTYVIGYQNSPPDQVVLPDGSPGGPAIEIVRAAA